MKNNVYWVVFGHSCGGCGEVCLWRNRLQPHKLFDWAAGTVNGYGGCQRECMGRNGVVDASIGSLCCRFFSWPIPYHRHRFFALHLGLAFSSIFYVFIDVFVYILGIKFGEFVDFGFSVSIQTDPQVCTLGICW